MRKIFGTPASAADAGVLLFSTGSERQHGGSKALYYVHIPKSGEPVMRLPSAHALCRLSYDPADGFTHPAYDALPRAPAPG